MAADSQKTKARILVVDDEQHVRRVLEVMLTRQGYEVQTAAGGGEALAAHQAEVFDLTILDLRMPDMDGLEVLAAIRSKDPDASVVMITAYASVETALNAMKNGAVDYIGKPFKEDEILLVVEKALERARMLADNKKLRSEVISRFDFANIIGQSPAMQRLFAQMRKVAPTRATVLLSGESGTGKELVARALHYNSPRKDRPFMAVNCAAIPEALLESELFGAAKGAFTGAERSRMGLVEEADGSSLFLDEVGELPREMQAKLLRVLQEGEVKRVGENTPRKVDVRFLAASNRDLASLVAEGRFREDLFYRLNVIGLTLPPLREREGDVALLAAHFLAKAVKRNGLQPLRFSASALKALNRYDFKGNVRELENLVEQAAVMGEGPELSEEDLFLLSTRAENEGGVTVLLPPGDDDLKKLLKTVGRITEEQVIGRVLKAENGNRTHAARRLGISRRALITKIQELGLG